MALIAAVVSYSHMVQFAMSVGEQWRSYLIPLTIDGLVAASSMVLWTQRIYKRPTSYLAWAALIGGGAISVVVNAADARPQITALLIAGWAPLAFLIGYQLLHFLLHAESATETTHTVSTTTQSETLRTQSVTIPRAQTLTSTPSLPTPEVRTNLEPTMPALTGQTLSPVVTPSPTGQTSLRESATPARSSEQTAEKMESSPSAAPSRPPAVSPSPTPPAPAQEPPRLAGATLGTSKSRPDSLDPRLRAPGGGQGIAVNRNAVIGFINQGLSDVQIANKMNCTRQTVYRIRKSMGNGHKVSA